MCGDNQILEPEGSLLHLFHHFLSWIYIVIELLGHIKLVHGRN